MITRNLRLLLLLGIVARANGDWTVVSSDEISRAAEQCQHIQTVVQESGSGDRVRLDLALCDSTKTTLRVIDQPNESRAGLAGVMQREHCLAGVNGGYFDADYAPLGLLIVDGRRIAPLRKARLLSGVLCAAKNRVRIERFSEFSMKRKINAAVQCGPFLVDRARPAAGLDSSRLARRTFVATGSANEFALGFCSEVSLAQLGRILLVPKISAQLKIEHALNLDGGSSSAFWFADRDRAFSIPEQKVVRDFVGIMPK